MARQRPFGKAIVKYGRGARCSVHRPGGGCVTSNKVSSNLGLKQGSRVSRDPPCVLSYLSRGKSSSTHVNSLDGTKKTSRKIG